MLGDIIQPVTNMDFEVRCIFLKSASEPLRVGTRAKQSSVGLRRPPASLHLLTPRKTVQREAGREKDREVLLEASEGFSPHQTRGQDDLCQRDSSARCRRATVGLFWVVRRLCCHPRSTGLGHQKLADEGCGVPWLFLEEPAASHCHPADLVQPKWRMEGRCGVKEFHLGCWHPPPNVQEAGRRQATGVQQKPGQGQLLTFNVESGEHTQRAHLGRRALPCPAGGSLAQSLPPPRHPSFTPDILEALGRENLRELITLRK